MPCGLLEAARRLLAEHRPRSSVKFGPGGYDFSQPEPLPVAAKKRVGELLESAHLFRYQTVAQDVSAFEAAFSEYIGMPHSMACNSGGCGIFLALKSLGVKPGDSVLVNAFTLAPVPGAIVHAGATPVFVNCKDDSLTIDVSDLRKKASASKAKVFLHSYMRGHVPDMDELLEAVRQLKLELIEDCAHTLGSTWKLKGEEKHRHIGSFGAVGVWSLQTNKSINSGEGGIISTSRQSIASFITVATGSYGHFHLNGASGDADFTAKVYETIPNMSMRMTSIAAALALPQLHNLEFKLVKWAEHAKVIRSELAACKHINIFQHPAVDEGKHVLVFSSIQFQMIGFTPEMINDVIGRLAKLGIPLAWFGGEWKGFTSTLKNWKFADPSGKQVDKRYTEKIKNLVDLPLYHTTAWSSTAFPVLARHIVDAVSAVAKGA
eukprot:TRINITY_DN65432_c0_g1_i1.p1 TRINITY_DN65432_c0_g1~~TRINITY_DN65432_c0_g1_i1.p1  ORF type:complete len:456 (+),score=66.66 TRINITY_DN65432_c0_g1_i1:67-1368(+)